MVQNIRKDGKTLVHVGVFSYKLRSKDMGSVLSVSVIVNGIHAKDRVLRIGDIPDFPSPNSFPRWSRARAHLLHSERAIRLCGVCLQDHGVRSNQTIGTFRG
jgi:hypothetical protein